MSGYPPPTRILIVKLSSLGDVVHALPVPCSLRATFPQARLAWVVEKKWLPLVARHPDLDEVFTIDSYGMRRRLQGWPELRRALAQVREFHPDWALDLQGTMKSAVITRWSGAALRAGFARPRERVARLAYTLKIAPASVHVAEQMLDVVAGAAQGQPLRRDLRFPFPIPDSVQAGVDSWIEENHIGEFAFFSPGGGWASKRWPSDRYAELADMLQQKYGLAAVLNRGPGERDMDDAYRRASQIRARLFSGDVEHLGAILRRARLVVGGDTGPLQLAAALHVPTVALFGPTDPARNGPYSSVCRVIRKAAVTTYQRSSRYSPAMLAITPDEVAAACGEMLQAAGEGRATG